MAADGGGLRLLFEKPLPENPTLLEALSAWNHHPNNKPVDTASFTEIFGELHFREKPEQHRAPRAAWVEEADQSKDDSSLDALLRPKPASSGGGVKRSSASSLLMCTEGLGSESTVDAGDMLKDDGDAAAVLIVTKEADADLEEETKEVKEKRPPAPFPPPIRSIGRGGKPGVCFRSFRADGRFVLVAVLIPGKDLLHAYRDGGRLRLQFAAAAVEAGGVGVDEGMHGEDMDHAQNVFTAKDGSNAMACPN